MPNKRAVRDREVETATVVGLSKTIGHALIGLLSTLIGTGIVSMILLYSHVSTMTDAQTRADQAIQRLAEHQVDKDDYNRRDRAVQKMLDDKATKDEVIEIRGQLKTVQENFVHATDNMASKEDLRQLRSMLIDMSGVSFRNRDRDRSER